VDDLRIDERFPGLTAPELWDAWTTADGVCSFWAQEATIDATVGGPYVLRWPAMDWTMRGEVTDVDPGRSITVTWSWDHEPDEEPQLVTLGVSADGDGSRLSIHHRPHNAEQAERRASQEEGWRHFSDRLRSR
jgi:uncharacterized protein YndB with AHSA1/START domain